ncbi:MAG TPA: hemopexin repeat-containing protein [Pyrinomonadaceae bacterium]|nr:hypothetical protein [Chloracidobacterium sp.]HBE81562.1 hypothetical protein [Blastocatellia bacterium]HRJ87161.1 hemopexin repeat-containing protein [Pyrinomonadaceae bacterium]HRK51400.1 hemopexin repeat-containing protein [Pyrinomonadaceae bacterium]
MKKRSKSERTHHGAFRTMVAFLMSLSLLLGPLVTLSPKVRAESIPAVQVAEVDAAFFHRGENVSYFFKGNQYYRLTGTNVDAGYPKVLPGEWRGLPASFHSGIDAAVQDPASNDIFFFKGNAYSAINPATKTAIAGYDNVTLPGGWQGLPAYFHSGIDAALDDNGSVILYKGNRQAVMTNYRFVSESAVPAGLLASGPLSAAFKYSNGRNYFFSGSKVSRAIGFDVEPRWPNEIRNVWIGVGGAQQMATIPLTAPVDPNSTRVTEVSFGPQSGERGLFRQVGDRTWEFRQGGRPNDKLETTCTELSRGADVLLLSCASNAYQYEINLTNRNVTKIVGSQRTFADQVKNTDTFQVIADNDLRDPFRPGDIKKIMAWISKETSNSRLDYCYKNTIGRGVGTPLTNCPAGTEKDPAGALCYPNCRAGFTGVGPICWGTCPQGFNDIGGFCQKTGEYTRDSFGWESGYPPLPQPGAFEAMKRTCEAKYGTGNCEIVGAAAYPKCKPGFKEGSAVWVCAPACPAGWDDTGTDCTKPSYGRTAGTSMICAPGLQEQAGLCYQNCSPGYTAVGPVCWQQCTGAQNWECGGIGCSSNEGACATAISDMVLAPFNLVVGLFSMGIANKVKAAADAAKQAANVAKGATGGAATIKTGQMAATMFQDTPKWAKLFEALKDVSNYTQLADLGMSAANIGQGLRDEIEHWTAEYEDNFAANTSPAIESRIRSQYDYNTQRYIKRYYALHHLGSILEADGWRIGKLVMTAGGVAAGLAGDPGFMATINAYSQPMCPPVGGTPFPRVTLLNSGTAAPPSGTRWDLIAGNLSQVSVGSDGAAWGVDNKDNIYQWTGRLQGYSAASTWVGFPGKLRQISVGSDYFVVGANAAGEVYAFAGNGWRSIAARAPMKQVSIGSDGKLWGVDTSDNIYRWDAMFYGARILRIGEFVGEEVGGIVQVPGKLKQISVGNAENVWGVNAGGEIYRWNGTTWIKVPGVLKQVSVGSDGSVWGVNPGDEIFRWTGSSWEKIPGGLNNISVADSGLVWGVNRDGQIVSRSF